MKAECVQCSSALFEVKSKYEALGVCKEAACPNFGLVQVIGLEKGGVDGQK